jgi:hypothetical protein
LIADIKAERAALEALQAPVSQATIEGLIGWLDLKLAEVADQDVRRFG